MSNMATRFIVAINVRLNLMTLPLSLQWSPRKILEELTAFLSITASHREWQAASIRREYIFLLFPNYKYWVFSSFIHNIAWFILWVNEQMFI